MKTLLVDDHALFRAGLSLLIGQHFAGWEVLEADSIAQACAVAAAHPDLELVLLDLGLPDSDGMDSLRRLRECTPEVTVVVLSADESAPTVRAAIDAGAAGFIPKTAQSEAMREALRRVLAGEVVLPAQLPWPWRGGAALLPAASSAAEFGLSPRQVEVLRLLVLGKSNKSIGRELQMSESTVKTHLAVIFRKLEVSSRTQAVFAAARLGLRLHGIAAG